MVTTTSSFTAASFNEPIDRFMLFWRNVGVTLESATHETSYEPRTAAVRPTGADGPNGATTTKMISRRQPIPTGTWQKVRPHFG